MVTGIVKVRAPNALTVVTATETLIIPLADIEDLKDTDTSMMPDDQLKPFSDHEVRSLFAGTLLADKNPWPEVGKTVEPGQVLGLVAVRVTPQERLELQNKLAEAMLKEKGAREIQELRKATVARLEKAPSAVIAQRDLDEAKVQLLEMVAV